MLDHTYEQSADIGLLAEAMSKVHGLIAPVAKKKKVQTNKYQYTYADLASVWEAARGALSDNQLAVFQAPCNKQSGGIAVVTTLAHASGQWMRFQTTMPCGDNAQAVGSAITYARRYALSSLLGIATEDDDGAAATESSKQSARRKPQAAEQRLPEIATNKPALVMAFKKQGITHEQLEKFLGHSLEHINSDEEQQLHEIGKAIVGGSQEAREIICGPKENA